MPVLKDRSNARRGIAKRSRGICRTARWLKYAWLKAVADMKAVRPASDLRIGMALHRRG